MGKDALNDASTNRLILLPDEGIQRAPLPRATVGGSAVTAVSGALKLEQRYPPKRNVGVFAGLHYLIELLHALLLHGQVAVNRALRAVEAVPALCRFTRSILATYLLRKEHFAK